MIDWFSYENGDFLLTPLYVLLIFVIGYLVSRNKIKSNPVYRYYLPGLMAKVLASIILLIIYTEYYGYGDTVDYLKGAIAMSKLMFKDPWQYLQALFGLVDYKESWLFFDFNTTYPEFFMWRNPTSRLVIGLTSIFTNLGFRYCMPVTVLMAFFSYMGVWKLFLFFTNYYPRLHKQMAIAVLFMPSVFFWSSGVLKDTYTFAAASWILFSIMKIFEHKKKILLNILLIVINASIIMTIKPYIFVALFPGIIIWVFFNSFSRIKNRLIRIIFMPALVLIIFVMVVFGLSSVQGSLGDYGSVDQMVKKAQVIQQDLIRAEQYGSNFYNVGTFDGSFSSLMKVAPQALLAGMYRPFLWESRNPVMMLSGIENTFLLLMTLYLLIKLKFIRFFRYVFSEPVLILSTLFTIFFLFSVGLASANFGALVRYKIPAVPFFVASIFIMLDKYQTYRKQMEESSETNPALQSQ